jgi:hypothetical protein
MLKCIVPTFALKRLAFCDEWIVHYVAKRLSLFVLIFVIMRTISHTIIQLPN